MGRSVSYPSGAIVAFTVLEVENDDDWDFEYEWLREDLRERAGRAFPSLIAHDGWRGARRPHPHAQCLRGFRRVGLRQPGCSVDRRA
jgi:hypothetical protein